MVVHMADLTCRLRELSKTPAYSRHSLALEALQVRFVAITSCSARYHARGLVHDTAGGMNVWCFLEGTRSI